MFEISVVKPLRPRERVHSVTYYHVEASTEVQASTKIREWLQDRCERWEHISEPRDMGDVQANSYSTCTPAELLKRQGKPLPEKKQRPEPKLSDKPLGEVQEGVLRSLVDHGGQWPGGGWVWDTDSGTRRILETLAQRCLVDRKEGGKRYVSYTINDHGRAALNKVKS